MRAIARIAGECGQWRMKPTSKEFLLAEYENVWKHNTWILDTRNKAVALYFGLIGAVAASGLALVSTSYCEIAPWIGDRYVGSLVCLPRYFAVPSLAVLLTATSVTLLTLIRFHALNAEYATVLNCIRAAFAAEDGDLAEYLTLPRDQNRAFVFRINFWIIMTVNGVGALLIWFLIVYILNAPGIQRLPWPPRNFLAWGPLLGAVAWLAFWAGFYALTAWLGDRDVRGRSRPRNVSGE